ncbi:MAG: hypothetical protein LBE89_03240, partial [Helicobacteraceae bacterium]|nr:hypothetical protein [Helicobacteraceae bacterium]
MRIQKVIGYIVTRHPVSTTATLAAGFGFEQLTGIGTENILHSTMAVKSPNFGADRIPELAFFPHIFRLVGMGVAP